MMVQIYEQHQLVLEAEFAGPAEFGRQKDETEPAAYARIDSPTTTRFIIARRAELTISRTHLEVEPGADGKVRVINRGKMPVRIEGLPSLRKDADCEAELPVTLLIEEKMVRLLPSQSVPSAVVSLSESLLDVQRNDSFARSLATAALDRAADGALDNESLIKWVQAIMGVLQGAASTLDFYPRAARAIVDLIGLDSGRVLVRDKDAWTVRALQSAARATAVEEWQPSRLIVSRVLGEKRTCFLNPESLADHGASLFNVTAVVAAPIVSPAGDVVGMLYGERRGSPLALKGISRLEGMLVEMLACGIAAGQARVEQEQAALRARVQMEQFFTPELSRHIADNPNLLQGRDVEVSMLSCDVYGFSQLCERLGPTRTLDWLNDVLGALSDCVLAEQGVLVDYVGDELLAMWGAPESQPDHAVRACRAGQAMLAALPRLDKRWQSITGERLAVRIGISTGVARVGNVGSPRKFKYGALGNTTNLASRVQSAARYLRTPLVITAATQQQLTSMRARRLGTVRVIGIREPVTLFAPPPGTCAGWDDLCTRYEEALTAFESGDHRTATRLLRALISQPEHRADGPALALLERSVSAVLDHSGEMSAVWELPAK
jgi:adenylate cyclase